MGIRTGMARFRLAVLASHPIQYQAPLFRALAAVPEVDLHVFFCGRWGQERYVDPGFGVSFSWDIPLLEGYRHSFLPNLSPARTPGGFLSMANPWIAAALLKERFDALLLHGWGRMTNWMAWSCAGLLGMPILLRGESNGMSEPTGLKGWIKRIALRTLFARVSGFLAIGSHNANFYRTYGIPEAAIFWTPYAVDNGFFMERARELETRKRALKEREGLAPDLPVVLYCGKFIREKRPLDLLEALATLKDEVRFGTVLVGDGPLRADVERLVVERRLQDVRLVGFRNQRDLPIYYSMSDVLVLPSGFEPWGLVVNEAMCFGVPVITSDRVGSAADLVREGENGFTYPVGDVVALADRLRRVLIDGATRREMGGRSRDIIARWGIDETVDGVLNALRSVAPAAAR